MEAVNTVQTWCVEWNPNYRNPYGWLEKSSHQTHGDAVAAMKKYLRDTIHDSDPNHWRICGYYE